MFDCWKKSCQGAHRRPDDGDDEQHRRRGQPALHPGDEQTVQHRHGVRVSEDDEGDDEEVRADEEQHEPLPAAEAARERDAHQPGRGERHREVGRDAEVAEGEADADELGDDREEVEHEQVTDGEGAPEPAETLVDQPGVTDAGHSAEPDDHLLVDDEHRDEQGQGPEQAEAEVLPSLGVGRHATGVVVADHHDQARPHDREQGEQRGASSCDRPPARRGGSCRRRPRCPRGAPRRARHSPVAAAGGTAAPEPGPASLSGTRPRCGRRARSGGCGDDGPGSGSRPRRGRAGSQRARPWPIDLPSLSVACARRRDATAGIGSDRYGRGSPRTAARATC